MTPTLSATPGDLSLVLPKRILDGIMEMIYALDKIAPGTANDDTLLYGVEVKFYNMEVELDENLQSRYPGLYIIGDGSGVTHSLSHASAIRYGFSFSIPYISCPYVLYIFTASVVLIPYCCKKIIACRRSFF